MKWDVFVNCKIAAGGFVCFEQKLLHSRSQQPWVWCCGIALESSIRTLAAVGGPLGARGHHGARGAARADGSRRRLRRVHVRLLLGLPNIPLVADPLVSKPVTNLAKIELTEMFTHLYAKNHGVAFNTPISNLHTNYNIFLFSYLRH